MLILVSPGIEHKAIVDDYKREFEQNGEFMHGSSYLDECVTYEGWLKLLYEYEFGDMEKLGKVNATTYLAIRKEDQRMVGIINIRHNLSNECLREYYGNIGYSVRKIERHRGYASEMLKQALVICRGLGISKALITCDVDNVASARTIELCGGVFERETERERERLKRYWIETGKGRVIKSDRLILRNYKMSDLEEFYINSCDPDVGPRAGWQPHESREESYGILKEFIKRENLFAITLKENGKVIGSIELMDRSHGFYREGIKVLGYVLAKPYWGSGYMTEAAKAVRDYAFKKLKIALLEIDHFLPNGASRRVIEKCGFKRDGETRMYAYWIDGSICGAVNYSMTAEEWRNIKEEEKKEK